MNFFLTFLASREAKVPLFSKTKNTIHIRDTLYEFGLFYWDPYNTSNDEHD